jgi:hypothetical protein
MAQQLGHLGHQVIHPRQIPHGVAADISTVILYPGNEGLTHGFERSHPNFRNGPQNQAPPLGIAMGHQVKEGLNGGGGALLAQFPDGLSLDGWISAVEPFQ